MANNPLPAAAKWVKVPAAATYAGVSEKTIRRLISRGEIQATKPTPRVLRVNLESLDNYLQKHATDQWAVA